MKATPKPRRLTRIALTAAFALAVAAPTLLARTNELAASGYNQTAGINVPVICTEPGPDDCPQ